MSDGSNNRFAPAWHRVASWAAAIVRDPVRLLIATLSVLLVVLAVPLIVTGARRVERAFNDWRYETSVREDWISTEANVVAIRGVDGLALRLVFLDDTHEFREAEVHLGETGWIDQRVPIRYDPSHPRRVVLVGIDRRPPLGSALSGGAAIGAGMASLVLGASLWRRRKQLAKSRRPISAMSGPLAVSATLLAMGIASWVVGTVMLQGWSAVGTSIGNGFSALFGDLIGIVIPLLAFAAGCIATAWLARHRHHQEHVGLLSDAHRMIDRAAGYAPSPEEIKYGARNADNAEEASQGTSGGDEPPR